MQRLVVGAALLLLAGGVSLAYVLGDPATETAQSSPSPTATPLRSVVEGVDGDGIARVQHDAARAMPTPSPEPTLAPDADGCPRGLGVVSTQPRPRPITDMAASLARDSALIVRGVLGHVSHELPILNIAPEVPSGMGAQPVVCHGLYRTLSVDLIEVYKGEHASPLTVHIQSGFECCVDIDPPFFDSYEAGQEWIFFLRPGGKTIFPEGTHRPVSEWIVRQVTGVVAKHDGQAPAPLDDVEKVLRR